MDVKTVFLNGNLEENVYMDQPVCKLKKSIYGLKQASRQWYLKFNDTIMSFEFKENIVDQCICLKVSVSKFIFLILYVDDILLATNNLGLLSETKKFLSNNFEMKDMGEAGYVIGIEIFCYKSQGLLSLSQKEYINKVLERFIMDKCSASPVPIQKKDKFSLIQCPIWKAVKKVLRYLQGTKNHMLTYRRSDHLEVIGYTDSDFASCMDTRKSTFIYVYLLDGGAISWKSAKQSVIAASTMEAEFVACFEATVQANWLRNFISGLGVVDSIARSLKIYCDHFAAILFSKKRC
uniref:Retrovirus-related Pol polyprotein from transposon TNT 1-94 n=1 Tax=Cajanus cajan TaxID=3821 RepID=A0A151SED1_CAJCA|nr:Retrovirus-related Pol polyprotein from transposon TNT 1-94 [Cajanus cajan]